MATPENTFIAAVHRHLPPDTELHREKMANPYRGGTADCWYSAALDLWVEYKFIVIPKRDATVIDLTAGKDPPLSALQQDWLRRRHDEGRSVWVIVGSKEGGVIMMGRSWEEPWTAAQFRTHLQDRKAIAQRIINFVT